MESKLCLWTTCLKPFIYHAAQSSDFTLVEVIRIEELASSFPNFELAPLLIYSAGVLVLGLSEALEILVETSYLLSFSLQY